MIWGFILGLVFAVMVHFLLVILADEYSLWLVKFKRTTDLSYIRETRLDCKKQVKKCKSFEEQLRKIK